MSLRSLYKAVLVQKVGSRAEFGSLSLWINYVCYAGFRLRVSGLGFRFGGQVFGFQVL